MKGNFTGSAAAAMAWAAIAGSRPGGDLERIVKIGRRSLARKASKKARRCLQIARGPGSISAKAEIDQLVWAGRFEEANVLAVRHFDACGEVLKGPAGLEQTFTYQVGAQ